MKNKSREGRQTVPEALDESRNIAQTPPSRRTSKTENQQGARQGRLPVSVSGQITLTTDFGTSDYYVGAVKGVLLSNNPVARIVDITHEIAPRDIGAAAFTIFASYRSFEPGTVHLVVVDPGVGSDRRPIVARAGGYFFVGPDNGIFSYVFDQETDHIVFHVTATEFFRQPVSTTFHGRDIFAPVAGAVTKGTPVEAFGPSIKDAVRLPPLSPKLSKKGRLKGRIIHIDRFGNCVTSIDREVFSTEGERKAIVSINGKKIKSLREFYGEEKVAQNLFAIWGSAGFLELSARNRSAARLLRAKRGDAVVVDFE